jgi:hypothetical protein
MITTCAKVCCNNALERKEQFEVPTSIYRHTNSANTHPILIPELQCISFGQTDKEVLASGKW